MQNKQTEKKETRGRKLIGETPRKARLLNIDNDDFLLLDKLGSGNKSEGLHILCEIVRKAQGNIKKN
jgi:hypothetical protein